MTAQGEITPGLAKLREPFPANQISKLPKESGKQRDERNADRSKAINCPVCGGWHHKNAVHLDYVGHAALTDRLLDCDPLWNWEPAAIGQDGLPALDRNGGMWIKLTVCGHTRLGYGSADGKNGGDAVKELIGDALRNAAMRFGAALDLWHKGDLHGDDDPPPPKQAEKPLVRNGYGEARDNLLAARTLEDLQAAWGKLPADVKANATVIAAKDARKAELSPPANADLDDEIPY